MLSEICAEVRNYFVREIRAGKYTITGGTVKPLDFLKSGQYFRIVGSSFNDGVYRYPAIGLTDEEFEGAIWVMAPPAAFVALADEIKAFCENDDAKPSPYTSESFGGYSYTKATGSGGAPLTWQNIFFKRLNIYRRMSVL